MLYHLLAERLQEYFSPLRMFQAITFRAIYATVLAFLTSILLGPWMIRRLQELRLGQQVRREGLQSHLAKQGTPTMGGLLIIAAWLVNTLLWARLDNPLIWAAVFAALWYGIIGFIDDWQKIRQQRSLGLTARQKIALQVVGAAGIGYYLSVYGGGETLPATALVFPFLKGIHPALPTWGYVAFVVVVIVGSANAVNLTDGQDGLAITCVSFVGGTLAVLAYVTSHAVAAGYLGIPHMPMSGELTVFCTALVGAGLGFLWWNAYPADVFMGDTGSMALGGAIGAVALAIKQELLLPILGGIFVAEAVSVMLQVGYYRRSGKRLFRMAPLHHHFEKGGMPEPKVTVRFWIVAAVLMLVAISTLKVR